ncbi:MAG: phage virion morphogenesis protein [Bacteroidaceae bacterium]|nr:phage virion morphogenesis protein [Bacteroidaceae bacterium]
MNGHDELTRRIDYLKQQIETEVNDRLPRKVGIVAVNFFKQNFRDAGFRDDTIQQWKLTKRQQFGKGAAAGYTPLLSARNHLFSSIQYVAGRGEVHIGNNVPYANIHNEGGTVNTHPVVTPRMRKYAWARYYEEGGKDAPGALKWRALALTKKTKLDIRAEIPRRQFIGESRELMTKIEQMVEESLNTIKDGMARL